MIERCDRCGNTIDTVPLINGPGGWVCSGDCVARTFPILGPMWAPREVPWALVEPHRRQALANHHQSLERLAERGGLDPAELIAVLEDRPWRTMLQIDAVARLGVLVGGSGS